MTKENDKKADKDNAEETDAANVKADATGEHASDASDASDAAALAAQTPVPEKSAPEAVTEAASQTPPRLSLKQRWDNLRREVRQWWEDWKRKKWRTPQIAEAKTYQALLLEHYKQVYDYTKFHIQLYATLVTLLVGVITFGFGELRSLRLNFWFFGMAAASGVFVIALFFAVAGLSGAVVASHIVYTDWNETFESGSGRSFWDNTWTFARVPIWVWAKFEHYLFWVGLGVAICFIGAVAHSAAAFDEDAVRRKAAEYTGLARQNQEAAAKLSAPQMDARRIKDFKANVESVEKVTEGVALVRGENTFVEAAAQPAPAQDEKQQQAAPKDITRTGRFTAVLLRDGGEWSVKSWNTDLREVR
ncbi:MAG TPA: hypothetical protein VM914_07950 [Pyrinomonadaceae bacterium]|jgi:hypothetical protein|nr:hypothetical protein [Pyrinomonadaceae bacterium]